MTPRLVARIEVSSLIRRAESAGGTAAVLAKGDATAGAILLYVADRGVFYGLFARRLDGTGGYRWSRTGPQDTVHKQEVDDYIERQRGRDPDLWVVELDVADAERFTAEMIAMG